MEHSQSFGKQIIHTVLIIAAAGAVVALMMLLGVGMWVPFLALCLWAMQGLKTDWKSVLSAYGSMAVGLLAGYLKGHMEVFGLPAIIAFAVLTLLLLHCMANHVMTSVFNNYTAIFTTVGTAINYDLSIYKDWAFAFILFGVLPACIVALVKKKKAAKVS